MWWIKVLKPFVSFPLFLGPQDDWQMNNNTKSRIIYSMKTVNCFNQIFSKNIMKKNLYNFGSETHHKSLNSDPFWYFLIVENHASLINKNACPFKFKTNYSFARLLICIYLCIFCCTQDSTIIQASGCEVFETDVISCQAAVLQCAIIWVYIVIQ